MSGTTHCRRYLFWFKGAGRAIPQRECLSEALLQPAGRNRLVRGGCLQPYLKVADAYRKGELTEEQALSGKVLKAILHYGGIEAGRPNDGPRFHASCFAIPTAAVNTYFCYLKQMDDAEGGKGGTLLQEACDMLKTIALQAWTQPLRHDETDGNVVSISRFRNHVVGGRQCIGLSFPIARGRHVPFHSYDRLAGGSLPARYQYDLPNYVFRCFLD